MVGLREAFKTARTKGAVEIAKGEIVRLWPKGTLARLFGTQAPITKRPHFLMMQTTCTHIDVTTDAEGNEVFNRCKWRAERGFLCRKHDAQVLNRVGKARPQPAFVPKPIQAEEILAYEAQELAANGREGYGLKFRIQFVEGLRMKSDPDRIKVPDAPPGLNAEAPTKHARKS